MKMVNLLMVITCMTLAVSCGSDSGEAGGSSSGSAVDASTSPTNASSGYCGSEFISDYNSIVYKTPYDYSSAQELVAKIDQFLAKYPSINCKAEVISNGTKTIVTKQKLVDYHAKILSTFPTRTYVETSIPTPTPNPTNVTSNLVDNLDWRCPHIASILKNRHELNIEDNVIELQECFTPNTVVKTQTDYWGDSLLATSVHYLNGAYDDIRKVEILLKGGFDPNFEDSLNNSALWTAVEYNKIDVVNLLLQYDLDLKSPSGMRGFLKACFDGKYEITKILLENGADPNMFFTKVTPKTPSTGLLTDALKAIDEYLGIDAVGRTPLINAVRMKHNNIVSLLIAHGANINYKDPEGWPVSFYATNSVATAKILIDAGVDINMIDAEGNTWLSYAYSNNNVELVELLIESGAKIEVANKKGQTVLDLATEDKEMLRKLKKAAKKQK